MSKISRSKLEPNENKINNKDMFLLFTLLGDMYALLSSSVIQILQNITITPITNNIPSFIGSTSFRGEIVPIIDLQSFFYGEQSRATAKKLNEQKNYVVVKKLGKTVFFQVESILGSSVQPEESLIQDLIQPSVYDHLKENPYFKKAFLTEDEQIFVQLNLEEILKRVIFEQEQSYVHFLNENRAPIEPKEVSSLREEFNIELQNKLSSQMIKTADRDITRTIRSTREVKQSATLVSINDINILIPNKHVYEIFNVLDISTAPNSSKALVGAINFCGDVLGVLDLAEVLNLSSTDTKLDSNSLITNIEVLILETEQEKIALVVDEIREVDSLNTEDIRPIQVPTNKQNSEYFFTGVKLGPSGQIIPILNVEYLIQAATNPAFLERNSNQIILFDNLIDDSKLQIDGSIREGILFEDGGFIFFLESENVVQVIDQHSLLLKEFAHDAIKGAAIHTNIVPIIDFNIILRETERNEVNSQKTVGLLVCDPKSDSEFVFLVDKVLNRVPSDKFEAYQTDLCLSVKALSPIISGFFSFQNTLGLTISPIDLLKATIDIVKRNLKLKNIKQEFSSTLLPDEIDFLEGIRTRRQELELMLFYQHEGVRLDYFVFRLRECALSIDVSYVQRVFASIHWQNVDSKHYPIMGIASINDDFFPVIDLAALILSTEKEVLHYNNNYFLLLKYQNHSFLVPVVDVEGVITIFKEETIPCEDVGMFLEGKKACKKSFSNENELLIYIIENKLLSNIFNNIDFDIFLKLIKDNMNEKED